MGFWKHYKALVRKNFILYKRNWKGSIWEICWPVFLMLWVLMLRFAFSKNETDPTHLLENGAIWYDQNNNGQSFFGYTIFNSEIEWFKYCRDREYGPDRTIIALAPSGNSMITEIKDSIEADLAAIGIDYLSVQLYESRDAIWDTLTASNYEKDDNPGICFAGAFTKLDTNDYQVNMIFDDILTERTIDPNMPNQELDSVDQYQRGPNKEAFRQYKEGGYMYLQNLFANALLRDQASGGTPYISMVYTPSKTSKYNDDDFAKAADNMWSFFILLIFLAPLYRFIYNSVSEKETKIREAMKIMGLNDLPYWLSWLTYYTIINTIQWLAMLFILLPVFEFSNKLIVFLYLWIYGMSLFSFGVFVGAFFSSAKTAAIAGTMLFYLTSFLTEAVVDRTISEGVKTLTSIFPSVAVQLAGYNLLEFESSGIGLGFENINELYLNYRFQTCLWMMTIFFFGFGILGLYLENVLPSAVGVRKPFYFPFTKQYWWDIKKKQRGDHIDDYKERNCNKIANSDDEENGEENIEINPDYFEEIPEYLRIKEDENQFIQIKDLKKRFGSKFYAINGLTGEMYEDQIFALLGHNGAGKTTTINALCGMLAPTSGEASIYGYNIKTEMKQIRKIMGICPQHNILFPKLTVSEHLSIFADFKGMSNKEAKIERDQLLKDLKLESKANILSRNLSGGYKRKLSLAIALCGGSKVVFLDEPSSGMDVTARREMWDMLKKYKNNRIIILTTHYMEEADNLGDRIGIMSQGKMLWWGSSDFLKNKFGEGYNLVMVKKEREDNNELESFVLNNIPNSKKVSEVSSEATYLLPKESSEHFSEFFKKLDRELENLKVSSYGVSMTTLEEVFLQVEEGGTKKTVNVKDTIRKRMTSGLNEENELGDDYSIAKNQIEGAFTIFFLHFTALFLKRMILSKRNIKGFMMDIFIPSFLIVAGFGLSTIQYFKDSDQRILSPSLFPLDQRPIYNTDNISGGGDAVTLMSYLDPSSSFQPFATTTTVGSTDLETLENFDDILYNEAQEDPLKPYRFGSYYFKNIDNTNHQYEIVAFSNTTSQESSVAFPQFMYEAILRYSVDSDFQYTMVNDPMPIVQIFKDRNKGGNGIFLGFVLGIALALIPTSIIGFILVERVNALLHQQIISGMNKISYWAANFLFDVSKTFVVIIIAIIALYAYELDYDYAWLLLFLFPTAIVAYTYATSQLFSEETTAQNMTILHHFFIAGLFPIGVFVLRLIDSTSTLGDALMWLGRPFPSYNVSGGIIIIALKDTLASNRKESAPSALSFKAAGGDVLFLCLHPFVWLGILTMFELGWFKRWRSKDKTIQDEAEELDSDVLKEQKRVENTSHDQLAVKADHLRKIYGSTVAVKDVSFALDFGDWFALLGVNGAGKTTTFKMLTGEFDPTSGNSHVVGFNVKTQFENARKQIGYCPQFDSIFDLMTVREHLEFYSKIKKIPKDLRANLINKQLKAMNLEQYENKNAGSLSGGNKRKLSVAMAMIGNPPVVFLDEPSAGMDPRARRFMWEIIAKISTRGKNSAVILTTHSMEEAEALSTNMGIMVAGQFMCHGSKQHIKNKFGTGYQVEIKFKALKNNEIDELINELKIIDFLRNGYASCYQVENRKGREIIVANKEAWAGILKDLLSNQSALKEFTQEGFGKDIIEVLDETGFYPISDIIRWENIMKSNLIALYALVEEFGQALLLEQYAPRYRYRVPKGDKSVGYFFSFMENLKEKLNIDEYSASQTTLEQIFNGFARLDEANANQRVFQKQDLESVAPLVEIVNRRSSLNEAKSSDHQKAEDIDDEEE